MATINSGRGRDRVLLGDLTTSKKKPVGVAVVLGVSSGLYSEREEGPGWARKNGRGLRATHFGPHLGLGQKGGRSKRTWVELRPVFAAPSWWQ